MTPKKKAEKLAIKLYYTDGINTWKDAKNIAKIVVDEIFDANPTWFIDPLMTTHNFWEEVKKEIDNL